MLTLIQTKLKTVAGQGMLLMVAAVLAIVIENSPLHYLYDYFLDIRAMIQIESFSIDKPLLLWINDGLMAIFFLVVGLEIKREIIEGELSSLKQASLPLFAALGGLCGPALIYVFLNQGDAVAMKGWAIPTATDIAFTLGIIALLGSRVPLSLKVFLSAVAIIDDLAAIVIIALFYTDSLSFYSLLGAGAAIAALAMLNARHVTRLAPYMLIGIFLWACVLKSGVHATLAGVVLAFFIPFTGKSETDKSPVKYLEGELHPWVVYGVLPIFAFANAGVSLSGVSLDVLLQPITLGVAAGLFFGKQLGVILCSFIAVAFGICKLPRGASWPQYYGIALITGVGFTMSLFIGTLAFDDYEYQTAVRLGVVLGSLLSGVAGYAILRMAGKKRVL